MQTTTTNRAPKMYFAVTNTTPAEHDVWDDASVNLLLSYKSRCVRVKLCAVPVQQRADTGRFALMLAA